MKTTEQLKVRAKQLGQEAASYSKQGLELIKSGSRTEGSQLMKNAYETSKRCQVVIGEILRRQQLEN
jgi:hypothetical protein